MNLSKCVQLIPVVVLQLCKGKGNEKASSILSLFASGLFCYG